MERRRVLRKRKGKKWRDKKKKSQKKNKVKEKKMRLVGKRRNQRIAKFFAARKSEKTHKSGRLIFLMLVAQTWLCGQRFSRRIAEEDADDGSKRKCQVKESSWAGEISQRLENSQKEKTELK